MTISINYPDGATEAFKNVISVESMVVNNPKNDRGLVIETASGSVHRRDLGDIANFTINE